jgi:phospholipid/cholesterol/gamma-HCH transport system ATP-binding protein
MNDSLIQVEHLVAHYGTTKVLDDVSLTVRRGEIFVILGASGCGKTTLLKHMTGLLHPTSGVIRYGEQDITQLDEDGLAKIQRGFGIAFQSGGLFNSLSVGENVAMPLREYSDIDDEALIAGLVRMKLGLVGLGSAEDLLPSELSGGMRKRAGLARAMAIDPPLVYFDEPSAGLDPITAAGLDELILNLRDLLGITFVIVTHELESIRKIADRMIMLDRGNVIFQGTLEDTEQADGRVRQFFERQPDAFIAQRNI